MFTKDTKLVCLGGGIGTVNLIRGLKHHTENITVLISTADDGGSAGRLRRLYNITPPGDAVSCLAALTRDDKSMNEEFLRFRFPGDRYGRDEELSGQKLGSLMLVAATQLTGDFGKAVSYLQKLFDSCGTILPVTKENLHLTAVTVDGVEVESEEKIDLGKYEGERVLEKVSIHPESPTVGDGVLEALEEADAIIAGPGDLYTTILPVLLVPQIAEYLRKADKKKFLVINVANKPFETRGYKTSGFVEAIEKHLGFFPFTDVVINSNTSVEIPSEYSYTYVENDLSEQGLGFNLCQSDLIDAEFPLYHSSQKLASCIGKQL